MKKFIYTLFLTLSFNSYALTLKQAFALSDTAFLNYYKETTQTTIDKYSNTQNSLSSPAEIETLSEKISTLLLNHKLAIPLAENILALKDKTISFATFKKNFSEILDTDNLFVITHLKNIKSANYADLVTHKNILTLDFINKKALSDLKTDNSIEVLTSRNSFFNALTNTNLLSNDQLNVQQALTNIPQITINPTIKKSQVLIVYFNNEGFSFTDDITYTIAKDWIKRHFSHMYKSIFFFIGDGEFGKDGIWKPNHLSEIPKSLINSIQSSDHPKNIFQKTLSALEKSNEIKNIDMFWLAHDGHAPFLQYVNPIKKGEITKLRYLNNSWCYGDSSINTSFPEMREYIRYTTGAIGKNNPFPYQFYLMDLLGKGLPISLSETIAKIMHLNFYNSLLNTLASNKTQYLAIKNLLHLYSSWHINYSSNGFSLFESSTNRDEFLSLSHTEFAKETMENDNSYTQKESIPLSQLEIMIANTFTALLGKNFLPEGTLITALNGVSFADFFKQIFRSLAVTNSYFLTSEKSSLIIDNSFEYSFSEELLKNLKFIILNQYRLTDKKNDISNIIAEFFTNLEALKLNYFEKTNKLKISWFASKSMSLESELFPFLKTFTEKLPIKISQIKFAKSFELNLAFDDTNKMVLKIKGLSIYTNYAGIVEIPEIIIDLKKGTINYLKNYPVIKLEK